MKSTIVYIDLLHHLPTTVSHAEKENHPFKLPQWRDISDQATACFYQLGAATIEKQGDYIAVPFSFNLSKILWEAASQAKEQPEVTYLQHRIKTALNRAVGRSVDFWFAYEVGSLSSGYNPGKPHLHGTILLNPKELRPARRALHLLNDHVSTDFKRFAVSFTGTDRKIRTRKYGELHVNLNWALYCMKRRGSVRRLFLPGQKTYSATRGITRQAEAYFKELRAVIKAEPTSISTGTKKPINPLFGSW